MLVYRYIDIHRWINTIVSPNIFFPSLLAQIVILAKKMGTTATAGDVSCYVQCNIPTWTVRKDMCTHEKVAIDNLCRKLFYAEKFLLCRKISFIQKIHLCRKSLYVENSFMQKILLCRKLFLCRKFFYAENSLMQKISFMQKNSFYAEKFLLGINPFTKQCPWLTCFSFACDIGTCNWMTFCISSNNTYNWRNQN